MTKPKPKPARAVDAVAMALDRERDKRNGDVKPIEIVKTAIGAYQAYHASQQVPANAVESEDRSGLRRGTLASVDRLLFNVNYWLSAYEDDIVAACDDADDARSLLSSIAAWNSHTMKLNTLSAEETVAIFERFCPPLTVNRRRGKEQRAGAGKGPVHDFKQQVERVSLDADVATSDALKQIVSTIQQEAELYDRYREGSPLDAFYDLLPAWCLHDRLELVRGTWWNDPDTMELIAKRMTERFLELGYAQPLCTYFHDAMLESIDTYTRSIDSDESPYRSTPIRELIGMVRSARSEHPDSETEGYGDALPDWLGGLEQSIWNTIVCAIYGPMHARPLLADSLAALPVEGRPASTDVITELAQRAYGRYLESRMDSGETPDFGAFHEQPHDLRNSGLERIESFPRMLDVLGYRIVPFASCYPEQRIDSLAPSEVECLAILEHRRWLAERRGSGWTHSPQKDVRAKKSPYLVDWEDLPDRAREWNRSSARDIPALLATVGLAISR